MKAELMDNPEFFRAFPTLQKVAKEAIVNADDIGEYDDTFKLEKQKEEKAGFFSSLLHHNRNLLNLTPAEMELENEKNFVDGYQTATGPLKWMDPDEKEKIHDIIDIKF